ncbi:hypothetical protein [Actinomadura sp. B10D3]|uniref:hypothetical protein n=1 Tax=Actinomadura sp. B10D3 TaxID=3153557 RepID=UPI00325C3E59
MSSRSRAHAPRSPAAGPPTGDAAQEAAEGAARRRFAALGTLLLTLTAVPAAVLVVPDASVNVVPAAAHALGLGRGDVPALLRATGLSLPALVAAVPLGAVAARRLPAWAVLVAGLVALLAGLWAARFAHSVALAGTVRAVQGAGAGIVLPASLVLVWERRSRTLAAVWAGALAGALVLAMPLALGAVPPEGGIARDWSAALAPSPPLAVAAAGAAIAYPLLRGRGPWRLPPSKRPERGRLLLAAVPVTGSAYLGVVAAHGWSPGARLLVAGLALPALVGLALAGGREAEAADPSGCAIVMIAAGLLCQPVAGPLAGLAGAGLPLDGAAGRPPLPFAAGACAALAGALAAARAGRAAVPAGCLLMAAAPLTGLAAGTRDGRTLLAALVLLGAGAGLALAASLRDAGAGGALFGLSLCFPAVLAGQLAVLSLQAGRLQRLRPTTEAQRLDALLEGYRVWLVAAGVAAALLAGVTARLRVRRAENARPAAVQLSGNAAPGPRAG